MPTANFSQILDYLQDKIPARGKEKFPGERGIQRMREFLERLGNPHIDYPSIHITGTSGKGSTAQFCARILQAARLHTGLHVSPHLENLRERIVVDGEMIPEADFTKLVEQMKPVIEGMKVTELSSPSYFEILVAAAFSYFSQQKVDAAVVEAGLGGRFDGTNVLSSSVSVITNVGLDHTQVLGNTKEEILTDKMQIIKAGNTTAVTGLTDGGLLEILRRHCLEKEVRLLELGRDFGVEQVRVSNGAVYFDFWSNELRIKEIKLPTPADYQAENAAVALAAGWELLKAQNKSPSETQIRSAFDNASFPGRFEIINQDPLLILDGAHNPDKMAALVKSLQAAYPGQKFSVVFGLKKNKAAYSILKALEPVVIELLVTEFHQSIDLGLNLQYPASELLEVAEKTLQVPMQLIPDSHQAYLTAIEKAKATGSSVLVTGSLYLVGELRSIIPAHEI